MIKMWICETSGHLALEPETDEDRQMFDKLIDFLECLKEIKVGWEETEGTVAAGDSTETGFTKLD